MSTVRSKTIVVKTQFEALHHWPQAPSQVSFLRHPHRHIFYVTVKWGVSHNDREKEFFMMKAELDKALHLLVGRYQTVEKFEPVFLGRTSCEDIADIIHKSFPDAWFVSVFEDNENGVEVIYEPELKPEPPFCECGTKQNELDVNGRCQSCGRKLNPHRLFQTGRKFKGVLALKRRDNLNPAYTIPEDGTEVEVTAGWIADSGQYKGQWVFLLNDNCPWLPEEDFEYLTPLWL